MRENAHRALAWLLLAALGAGCQSVKPPFRPDPGVTGYSMIGPYSVQRFVYELPIVERAAIEAMTDMKMHSVHRTAGKDGVRLKGYLYDGRYIILTLESKGPTTIVSILVDIYGDEPLSKILLERMGVRIATLPHAVASPFDPRAITDSITHRGQDVEGYRGVPLR